MYIYRYYNLIKKNWRLNNIQCNIPGRVELTLNKNGRTNFQRGKGFTIFYQVIMWIVLLQYVPYGPEKYVLICFKSLRWNSKFNKGCHNFCPLVPFGTHTGDKWATGVAMYFKGAPFNPLRHGRYLDRYFKVIWWGGGPNFYNFFS